MGDFQQNFHRPDAGIRTVEGNVAGGRAAMLEKKRQAEQEEFELEKAKRKKSSQTACLTIGSKFQPARIGSVEEQAFKAKTVGLVSAKDFLNAAKEQEESANDANKLKQPELTEEEKQQQAKQAKKAAKKKKKQKKKLASRLSFMDGDDDDDEEEGGEGDHGSTGNQPKESKLKDPTVDTSFLPDKQREESLKLQRQQLEQDWKTQQTGLKKEKLDITYSYWDGSGHRRSIVVTKGASVGEFLDQVRQDLAGDFKELRQVAADSLLYVKEDLILPHDITFYDLIVTKARGKSGPLFHFDVHDDVRIGAVDTRIEKEDSHPGKICERRWYERNKHIFPASRWELYDPAKEYGTYTIGDKKK